MLAVDFDLLIVAGSRFLVLGLLCRVRFLNVVS